MEPQKLDLDGRVPFCYYEQVMDAGRVEVQRLAQGKATQLSLELIFFVDGKFLL